MIDEEVVAARIAKIREYGRLLANILQIPRDRFIQEPSYYLQAERLLEVMIQAMTTAGSMMRRKLGLRTSKDFAKLSCASCRAEARQMSAF